MKNLFKSTFLLDEKTDKIGRNFEKSTKIVLNSIDKNFK